MHVQRSKYPLSAEGKERLKSGENVWCLSFVLKDIVKIYQLQNVGESVQVARTTQAKDVVQMTLRVQNTCAEGDTGEKETRKGVKDQI